MSDAPWYVQPIATLIASFTGAGFAFLLAGRRTKSQETNRQIGAINRALIVLFSMHGNLETYRQDIIADFVGRDDAWLNASVKPAKVWGNVQFDSGALDFLLEKKNRTCTRNCCYASAILPSYLNSSNNVMKLFCGRRILLWVNFLAAMFLKTKS